MSVGWSAVLNGVAVIGGSEAPSGSVPVGCMASPPDGLGVPPLRIEDISYPQRDGVEHFYDWYQPRLVTITPVAVCPDDDCDQCPSARVKMAQLLGAWSRYCDDTELVIFTDCHDPDEAPSGRVFTGPYGVVGRPRVATNRWLGGGSGCGVATLRFDGVDHRLYILDGDGTPGSGEVCVDLSPTINAMCRTYPRCYDTCSVAASGGMAYTESVAASGTGAQNLDNYGTLCAPVTVILNGPLSSPTLTNITTGETFTYNTIIPGGDTVTIDTTDGVATDSAGIDRSYFLTGDVRWQLSPGVNTIRLTSFGPGDTGSGEVCFRPAVLSA